MAKSKAAKAKEAAAKAKAAKAKAAASPVSTVPQSVQVVVPSPRVPAKPKRKRGRAKKQKDPTPDPDPEKSGESEDVVEEDPDVDEDESPEVVSKPAKPKMLEGTYENLLPHIHRVLKSREKFRAEHTRPNIEEDFVPDIEMRAHEGPPKGFSKDRGDNIAGRFFDAMTFIYGMEQIFPDVEIFKIGKAFRQHMLNQNYELMAGFVGANLDARVRPRHTDWDAIYADANATVAKGAKVQKETEPRMQSLVLTPRNDVTPQVDDLDEGSPVPATHDTPSYKGSQKVAKKRQEGWNKHLDVIRGSAGSGKKRPHSGSNASASARKKVKQATSNVGAIPIDLFKFEISESESYADSGAPSTEDSSSSSDAEGEEEEDDTVVADTKAEKKDKKKGKKADNKTKAKAAGTPRKLVSGIPGQHYFQHADVK